MTLDAPPPPRRELSAPLRTALVLSLLYLFLVGVSLLESGIKHLGAGFQEGLLESVTHPLAGLFAGVLATVLVQSSSVSTATIVGLVGSGTLTVEAAIPMIMGANIGTTITNTLASLGSIRRSDEFRRAFAGATMHDFFNLIAVALFLPLELLTGFLSTSAEAIADLLGRSSVTGGEASSPIKEAVKLPSETIVSAIDDIGLATAVAGVVILTVGLGFIFLALTYITRNMRQLIAGRIERTMNRLIGKGGGFAGIVIGMLVTIAVQSSSITTSILVPMVAAGVLTLPNAYPVTLGANVGTTVTALLASLAVELPAGLEIALVHTLFNLAGIALLYPIPAVRLIPVRLAQGLADLAVRNRSMVVAYVLGTFVLVPMAGIVILR